MTLQLFPYTPSFGILPNPTAPDRREFINPNNQLQNARSINVATGDYALNANGHFVGMAAILQQVYLAIATVYNSSAQQGLGQQFSSLKVNTQASTQVVSNFVNLALSSLVSANKIIVNEVDVVYISTGQLGISIDFTDLTTNQAQSLQVGFQQLSNQPQLPNY